MQDWDRLVMMGVGLAVSCYTGVEGYRLWKRANYLAVAGIVVLICATLGVPLLLALSGT